MNTISFSTRCLVWLLGLSVWLISGCTPAYTKKTGSELAGHAGLVDSISIARGNQRLLSRQGQVCLLSDAAAEEQEQVLLRTVQTAFSGYFVAVGMESQSFDYSQALGDPPCPGASYLIFMQSKLASCNSTRDCRNARSEFIFTIVNRGDLSLLDRVQLTVKNTWLPTAASQPEHWEPAFEQLAASLVGVAAP